MFSGLGRPARSEGPEEAIDLVFISFLSGGSGSELFPSPWWLLHGMSDNVKESGYRVHVAR